MKTHRLLGSALVAGAVLLAGISASSLVASAAAYVVDDDQHTPDEMLTLYERHAAPPYDVRSISPEDPAFWEIRAEHDDPSGEAALSVQIEKRGPLAEHEHGLHVEIEQCLREWIGVDTGQPFCEDAGGSLVVTPDHDLADGPSDHVYMLPLAYDEPHHFLVTFSLRDDADPGDDTLQNLAATVDVGVTATVDGEEVTPTPTPPPGSPEPDAPLAPTGGDLAQALRLGGIALAALVAALGIRLIRRRPEEVHP